MRRALIAALVVAVLAFVAWRAWQRSHAPAVVHVAAPDTTAAGVRAVKLYFGAPDGDGLVSEMRELPEAPDLHARVAALIAALDEGPRQGGVAVLPAGTSALHVYLDDRGLLTLDLSQAFVREFRGGSSAEWGAVASLVRTLADNLSEVKLVQIACGGSSVRTLGGHVPLDQPLDVSDWP
jgi:hypothetical protein